MYVLMSSVYVQKFGVGKLFILFLINEYFIN